eukprot:XP_014780538.1 PREDICTED: THUMP domain-containing protein 3-like [Octopus bimaculoides]
MKQLQYLVENVDWRMGLKVWSQVYSFHLPISEKPVTYPVDFGSVIPASAIPLKPKQEKSNRNDYGKKKRRCKMEENENMNKGDKVGEELIECDVNIEEKADDESSAEVTAEVTEAKTTKKSKRPFDPTKPTFRVTCHRSGENHAFSSMIAAANFGGAIQTYFDWNVDMKDFNIEVILRIVNDSISVSIALTKESLHRRLITNFGPTTLRATTAYNMLRNDYCMPEAKELFIQLNMKSVALSQGRRGGDTLNRLLLFLAEQIKATTSEMPCSRMQCAAWSKNLNHDFTIGSPTLQPLNHTASSCYN